MLLMGRGSGERQSTDINGLLDQSTRLAYHSARATDKSFNLDIRQDLDPEMQSSDVVPQDMGRVFLNLVSNACYATDQKRRTLGGGCWRTDRWGRLPGSGSFRLQPDPVAQHQASGGPGRNPCAGQRERHSRGNRG